MESDHPRAVRGVVRFACGNHSAQVHHKNDSHSRRGRDSKLPRLLAFLSAFGPFVTDFYLPTLHDQTADFGASASMVQFGLSATMWGLAAGQLWIGPLSDTRGRRIPLAASLAVFSLATAGAVFAPDIETFIAMRFLEGLGASGAVVMSRSIAADLYAGRELAALMAVVGAFQGIAPVTSPLIGALIAEASGWREIFMLLTCGRRSGHSRFRRLPGRRARRTSHVAGRSPRLRLDHLHLLRPHARPHCNRHPKRPCSRSRPTGRRGARVHEGLIESVRRKPLISMRG